MQNQATPKARKFSKILRRNMTDGERRLWQKLRLEQLGVKFRRQHPFGNYVADFACLAPPLIVELDGSQHTNQQPRDLLRDAFFRQQGFEVLRFPANQPFVDLQAMAQAIYNRLLALKALKELEKDQPLLLLPPLGEGRDGGLPECTPHQAAP